MNDKLLSYTDDWGRLVKWFPDRNEYLVIVNGVWHTMTPDYDEPLCPVRPVEESEFSPGYKHWANDRIS